MKKKLLLLPAVGLGVLALVLLARAREGPRAAPPGEIVRTVQTIVVPRIDVHPRAVGYGVVRPGSVWQAVPQVGGRLTEIHTTLKEGDFVKKGDTLLRIDTADYDLEFAAAEGRLASLQAQLAELTMREETLKKSLEIEQRSLALARSELERIKRLVAKDSLAPSDQDREERSVLTQNLRVQEIQNSLRLLPPQRAVLNAQITQETSQLGKARLALERTVIQAPFDGRLGAVQVEEGQVVQAGQALFTLDGVDTSEVTAQVPLSAVRQILGRTEVPVDPVDLAASGIQKLGLTATVRLHVTAERYEWPAEVVRVRGIDAQTRTVGIDVSVKQPYAGLVPGRKPPLARGMYVEVVIRGRPQGARVVVPRHALHDGEVYLVDPDKRLERRSVGISLVQSTFAVVESGLDGGETLVVSDLVPAITGMRLDAADDAEASASLEAAAAGDAAVR